MPGCHRRGQKCGAARPLAGSRVVVTLLLALAACLPARAYAQGTALGTAQETGQRPAAVSPAQAQQVLDVLNDPAKRAAFASTLSAMAKALPATQAGGSTQPGGGTVAASGAHPAAATAVPTHKVVLAPNSLGGELLGEIGTARTLVIAQSSAFGRMFSDAVLAGRWLRHELADPDSRAELADAAWRGSLVVLAGLLVENGLSRLLRRPLRALARDARVVQEAAPEPPADIEPEPAAEAVAAEALDRAPEPDLAETAEQAEKRADDAKHRWRTLRLLRRVPFALLRLMIKLVPLLAFLAIGNFVGGSFDDHPVTQLIIVTVTNLYGTARLLYLLVDMVLAARAPGVRLIGVTDSTAMLLARWWAWLVGVGVFAFAIADVGGILNLPDRAAQSITRAVALVEHILLASLIWQVRDRVAASLVPPRRFRGNAIGGVLARMAAHWWIPALFFDFALWVVWAAGVRDGYARIWRLFIVTVIVVFACRLAGAALLGLLDRLFRIDPSLEQRYPGLERRANRYYPLLRRVVNVAVLAAAAIVLLQAWGLPTTSWFTRGALGSRLVSALISILVSFVIGIVVWELANAALDRQIAHFGRVSQSARAVRLQTLLPILRTVLFIVLAIIIGMTVLSEIGVNIAPLLAGAGILGVAIGFGSQKLVQDFITGIFLLVENAMQVGDTVTAAGVTGTVEHLSIRTLRLRGGDGSVQIIPFSSVSTVTNTSRDFAVAAIAISVSVTEDTDRVCAILRAIGSELRTDPAFADFMVGDFGLNGVDGISEYAVTISGTIKCTVGGRWPVQREFYRRLGIALNAEHVAMPARPLALPGLEHEAENTDHD